MALQKLIDKVFNSYGTSENTQIKSSTLQQTLASYANLGGATFTGGVREATVALESASVNLLLGNCFTKTITGNTTFTFVNSSASTCFTLILTNGGSATITWPSNILWDNGALPALTASGVDMLTFVSPDGGTTWFGMVSMLNAKLYTAPSS